jgi:translation initiation factor RLI1
MQVSNATLAIYCDRGLYGVSVKPGGVDGRISYFERRLQMEEVRFRDHETRPVQR